MSDIYGVSDVTSHAKEIDGKQQKQAEEKRVSDLRSEILRREEAYHDLPQERQEEYRLRDDYHIPQNTTPGAVTGTAHQTKFGIGLMRPAIENNLSRTVYQHYDEVVSSDMESDREVTLHHARGTVLTTQGYDVVTINIAGSSFSRLRKEQSGFKGKKKSDVKTISDAIRFQNVYGTREYHDFKDEEGVELYKKERQLQGKGMLTKYTISGPMAAGGLIDQGQYKMENLKSYILELGREYLIPVFESWKEYPGLMKEQHFVLTAHSRGAASISLGTKALIDWAREAYGREFAKFIKVDFIQRDPVPGPDGFGFREMDLEDYPEVNATTIYSLETEYRSFLGFTPQNLRGQKRIILMAAKHSVDQEMVDGTQIPGDEYEKYRQEAYVDVSGMEAYRGTGLSDLPEGVYLRDENNALVRVRSYQEAMKVIREVRSGISKKFKETSRAEVYEEVIKNWFLDNEYVDPAQTTEELKAEHLRALNYRKEGLTLDSSDKKMGEELEAFFTGFTPLYLTYDRQISADTRVELLRQLGIAISSCKAYMERKNAHSDESQQEWTERVSQMLSAFRAEKKMVTGMTPQDLTANAGQTWEALLGKEEE